MASSHPIDSPWPMQRDDLIEAARKLTEPGTTPKTIITRNIAEALKAVEAMDGPKSPAELAGEDIPIDTAVLCLQKALIMTRLVHTAVLDQMRGGAS